MKFDNASGYVNFLLIFSIIFVLNIISGFLFFQLDLTDDNRYTISDNTKAIIASIDDNITVRILLEGEFPAGFKRLQSSVKDILIKFRDINSKIIFEFEDPSEGTPTEIEQKRKILQDDNIIPISLSYSDETELVQKAVFPFAIINYNSKKLLLICLKNKSPGMMKK